ncbi:hypothetical protein ZEAMMB73_Zm00001d033732 [Zea mays]|uniref:Uncharacterized protein n=1 Tax=Zea mays TaxID=4577 RepID=A0A1D6L1W8_MAIZE|nr:hypothetical protein ZEAMMB73_Zm00001d033732 [Zea mays]ONM08507.1 hypothetical protein ZEAMMB73_Zm00001d033732 [Zea mays]
MVKSKIWESRLLFFACWIYHTFSTYIYFKTCFLVFHFVFVIPRDLSHNNLNGPIPDFYVKCHHLHFYISFLADRPTYFNIAQNSSFYVYFLLFCRDLSSNNLNG